MELKVYAKQDWIHIIDVRSSGGKDVSVPHDSEVVVFRNFLARIRFPLEPIMYEIVAKFNFYFHQLTPECFMIFHVFCGPVLRLTLMPSCGSIVCFIKPRRVTSTGRLLFASLVATLWASLVQIQVAPDPPHVL
jgi:hypothetical protein